MARFSRLAKGNLEGEVIEFEIRPGVTDRIRIVPLLGACDLDIAERARKLAESKGGKAEPGQREYEIGVHVFTLLMACKDPDSPIEGSEPYFASVEEILDEQHGLDRGRIVLLFEHQARIQELYAPRAARGVSAVEFFEYLERTTEVDEGAELPFERLPRATQRIVVRGFALLAKTSLLVKSGDGQFSQGDGKSSVSTVSTGTSALGGEA